MLALAAAGAPEGSWLRAEVQTAGRGRQGREWASPAGNLYASTLVRLRPGDPPAPTLALVAAVALHECIGAGRLKWPNDLLIDGAKVSGILLERVGDGVVIGNGVNIVHRPVLERPTTSLRHNGIETTAAALLRALVPAMARWIAAWRADFGDVREAWLAAAHPPGTPLAVTLPDGEALTGTFDTLTGDGALVLRLASGEAPVIHAGDVFQL